VHTERRAEHSGTPAATPGRLGERAPGTARRDPCDRGTRRRRVPPGHQRARRRIRRRRLVLRAQRLPGRHPAARPDRPQRRRRPVALLPPSCRPARAGAGRDGGRDPARHRRRRRRSARERRQGGGRRRHLSVEPHALRRSRRTDALPAHLDALARDAVLPRTPVRAAVGATAWLARRAGRRLGHRSGAGDRRVARGAAGHVPRALVRREPAVARHEPVRDGDWHWRSRCATRRPG
jgi:hypothetical protein